MKQVIATVTLANPEGGPSLPAGVPVTVDDTDETIRSYLNSGYLLPVTVTGDSAEQPWQPGDPAQPVIQDQAAISGGQVAPDAATGTPEVQIQERRAQTESVTTLAQQQAAKEEGTRRRSR